METRTVRFEKCILRAKTESCQYNGAMIFDDKRTNGRRLKWWGGYDQCGTNKDQVFKNLDREVRKEFGNLVKAFKVKKDQSLRSNCTSFCLYLFNS